MAGHIRSGRFRILVFLVSTACSGGGVNPDRISPAHEHLSAYIKTEAGFESNIYEVRNYPTSDRGLFHWGGITYRNDSGTSYTRVSVTGNYSAYRLNPDENKLSGDFRLNHNRKITNHLFWNPFVMTFIKRWYSRDWGYHQINAGSRFSWHRSGMVYYSEFVLRNNRFINLPQFNSDGLGLFLGVHRRKQYPAVTVYQIGVNATKYPREMIVYADSADTDTLYQTRRDNTISWLIRQEQRGSIIWGTSLNVSYTTSSIRYFSFWNAAFRIYSVSQVRKTVFHIILEFQYKRYTDSKAPPYFYNPDPEQNVQNRLFLGFERDLYGRVSLTGKAALIYNETQYRSVYYRKTILSLGLQYRFE